MENARRALPLPREVCAQKMTTPQNNSNDASNPLLQGIQSEVSDENAPLLNFITRYAGIIAGVVLTLLLVLGGMAIWNWHKTGKQEEARAELARINMQFKGEARDKALLNLAQNAPDSTKLFIYMSLGQSAQENGNPVLAADAYARAAKLDGDGPLGLAAALGSVGSLMMQSEFKQAFALLQELDKRLPAANNSPYLQQMLAEAALRTDNRKMAENIYRKLSENSSTPQSAYFKKMADKIAAGIPENAGDKALPNK